jgi:hypothetical protein
MTALTQKILKGGGKVQDDVIHVADDERSVGKLHMR